MERTMNILGRAAFPLTALALFAVAVPRQAEAQCCVAYDYANATANVASVETHFDASLAAAQAAIVNALLLHSGQQTQNSQAQTASVAQMNDLHDQRETVRRNQDQSVRATNAAISGASVCNVITGVITAQNLEAQVAIWRGQAVQAALPYESGIGPDGKPATRAALIGFREAGHCSQNATAADVKAGICPTVTQKSTSFSQGPNDTSPTVSDDLNADTILRSTTLSAADTQSATQFLVAAVAPAPMAALPPGFDPNTSEGRRLVAERHGMLSRDSIAHTAVAAMIADRVSFQTATGGLASTAPQSVMQPGAGTASGDTATLASWAEATAGNTLGYTQDSATGKYFPNGVSKLGFLELRAKAWFFNPNWGVQLDGAGVDQSAKDIAMMQSFAVYQNWEQYRVLERINMSLAAILSILQDDHRSKL